MSERCTESRSPHSRPQRHGVRRHDDKGVETTAHGTVSQPEPHGEVAHCARNVDLVDTCSACHALCGHHKFDYSIRSNWNVHVHVHVHVHNVHVHVHDHHYDHVHVHDHHDSDIDDIFDHDCGDNDDIDGRVALVWFQS